MRSTRHRPSKPTTTTRGQPDGRRRRPVFLSKWRHQALYCDNDRAGMAAATTAGLHVHVHAGRHLYAAHPRAPDLHRPGVAEAPCCTGLNGPAGLRRGVQPYTPAAMRRQQRSRRYCSPGIGLPGECTPGCSCNTRRTGESGKCSITGTPIADAPTRRRARRARSSSAADPRCPNTTPAPTSANCSVGVLVDRLHGAAPSAACTDKVWDPVGKVYTATTLLQDARSPTAAPARSAATTT